MIPLMTEVPIPVTYKEMWCWTIATGTILGLAMMTPVTTIPIMKPGTKKVTRRDIMMVIVVVNLNMKRSKRKKMIKIPKIKMDIPNMNINNELKKNSRKGNTDNSASSEVNSSQTIDGQTKRLQEEQEIIKYELKRRELFRM